jgi:hypothetical protein
MHGRGFMPPAAEAVPPAYSIEGLFARRNKLGYALGELPLKAVDAAARGAGALGRGLLTGDYHLPEPILVPEGGFDATPSPSVGMWPYVPNVNAPAAGAAPADPTKTLRDYLLAQAAANKAKLLGLFGQ